MTSKRQLAFEQGEQLTVGDLLRAIVARFSDPEQTLEVLTNTDDGQVVIAAVGGNNKQSEETNNDSNSNTQAAAPQA